MTRLENDGKSDVKSVKSDKERSNKRSHKKEKQKPQTKVVIRHLPPTMTEEDFLKQTDPLPPHDFYYFAAADWSLGYDATCRAYITMKNYDDVFLFRDRFDGYVFVDTKGAEYPAIVEFAPFQGLVKNKSRRVDNKVNTIEQEPHYQQFLAKLEEDREAAKGGECKLEFSLDRKKEEKITSTPLLQYLANKKEKRREEAKRRQEEKRRQREEDKEKRKQAQSQQQVTKIISNTEGGAKGGNKSASGKENIVGDKSNQQQQPEEGKSSRSQRRAERNQRRREEFVRRRQEGEQREKATDGKTKTENEVEPSTGSENKLKEQTQQANKSDDGKQASRKEGGKRYSERRERDRNRNRKEKEKEKTKDTKADDEEVKAEGKSPEAIKAAAAAAAGGEAIVSESVMNFIRSVATAKEFVPKHKQQEKEGLQNKSSDEAVAQTTDEMVADAKTSVEEQKKSDLNLEDDLRAQKQRTAEEQRRIRNKDRPSIAIYQPKARLRISEERDPSGSRAQGSGKSETRSNPTSDCESVKKEETRGKKVSRYSERRAERRNNKDKQKNFVDPIESEQKIDAVEQQNPDGGEGSQRNISNTEEKEPRKSSE
ncbi:regulator of nonsense transcripts 3B [Rhagoletis pomonella]|uniref:regulator of nonsense transcripts 3B n=1 Tax=Rhagoletis pomonella TaxID=28610 RepID=UPI00177D14F2|nr:regulator of nonsense transcripts 3B [Rhagoletis pomonella]